MSAAVPPPPGGRSPLHGLATRFGLGAVALHAWHLPRGRFATMVREGGPLVQRRIARGRAAMRRAAQELAPLVPPAQPCGVPVTVLTGAAYWDQTVFALASLQHHAGGRIDPVVFDDGTLAPALREAIARVLPWTRFVPHEEVEARLEARLPAARYPALRARRAAYPHLRKLTDLHAPDAWSLVLDSDVLFFRRPDALLAWMAAPSGVLLAQDVARAYGYSDALMASLARGPLPERLNAGLYGLHGGIVDFDYLEHCCRAQLARERASYLQEQALTALLVAGHPATLLPAADYRVLPDPAEGRRPTAAFHHYVAHARRSHFIHGWRRVCADLAAPRPTGPQPQPQPPAVLRHRGRCTAADVSVIVPVRNGARTIGATLAGIAGSVGEVVVIDDASTDGSAERAAAVPGVIVFPGSGRGAAAARNRGLLVASGERILFLDADDVVGPGHAAALAAALDRAGPHGVAFGRWARFRQDPAEAVFPARPTERDMPGVDWLVRDWAEARPMTQCGMFLIPRALIERVGGWNERLSLCDDFEFFARVIAASDGTAFAPGARLHYRSGDAGSLSARRSRRALESQLRALLLGAGHLLAAEDSARTRRAAAAVLKAFDYAHYPAHADLRARAAAAAAALGGSPVPPAGPPNFHRLRRLLGWRAARRLERAFGARPPAASLPETAS